MSSRLKTVTGYVGLIVVLVGVAHAGTPSYARTIKGYPVDFAKLSSLAINDASAPKSQGQSQAMRLDKLIFVSGQSGIDPNTMALVPGGVVSETQQAIKNVRSICQRAGADPDKIMQLTVYLVNSFDYKKVRGVITSHMKPPYPALTMVVVSELPKDGAIEIQAVAYAE